MKPTAVALAALVLSTALFALAPAAEARQACVYGQADPCDDHVVCVWDRLSGAWRCAVYVDPCWFRCWLP